MASLGVPEVEEVDLLRVMHEYVPTRVPSSRERAAAKAAEARAKAEAKEAAKREKEETRAAKQVTRYAAAGGICVRACVRALKRG